MKPLYQWIIRDGQETGWPLFRITRHHYESREAVAKAIPAIGEYLFIKDSYSPSRITDPEYIRQYHISYPKIEKPFF